MDDSTKIGLGLAALAAAAAGVGVALARRGKRRGEGLSGTWSTDVEKLAAHGQMKKGVTVSWGLPPGPTPSADSEHARESLRDVCRKAGGKKGLYRIKQERWEDIAQRRGLSEREARKGGKEVLKRLREEHGKSKSETMIQKRRLAILSKHLGVSEEQVKKLEPGAISKLSKRVGAWWDNGTCPGCSEQCSRSCYVSKTMAMKFTSQRQMWGNVCDVVEGKGLPEIFEDTCSTGRLDEKGRPCGKKDAVTLVPRAEDPASRDLLVDTRRVDATYVRVHVSGDFFDREYAKAWLAHARKSIEQYKREYEAWQRGDRKEPPLRVHYWTYTRSWRLQNPRLPGTPDAGMLDVIREFPTLTYPAEYWPAWTTEVDEKTGEPLAGKLRRGVKPTFAVLLSADSSTGIPWVKDKRNRIMPVSFVLNESDLTTLDEQGRPVVFEWDTKIPGIVLRDHSLRKMSKAPDESWKTGKGQFWCPMEDPGKTKERKKQIGGCFNCRLCLPETAQNVAEVMFKRYIRGWPDGEGFAIMEAAKRGETLPWYEEWQRKGPVFTLAVPAVGTNFNKLTGANKRRVDRWQAQKLRRLPLVGE